MKATIDPPLVRTVSVEMTETEAQAIRHFVYCYVAGVGKAREALRDLEKALERAGVGLGNYRPTLVQDSNVEFRN